MSINLLPLPLDDVELLLATLRRCDRDAALILLAKGHRPDAPPQPALSWAQSHHIHDRIHESGITARAGRNAGHWALGEAARHVAEGRFEHAACLIERYGGAYCDNAQSGPALMILPDTEVSR